MPNELLGKVLEAEKERVYDYLIRMTGQISRSVDAISEGEVILRESLPSSATEASIKVELFKMCRGILADIWNADTSRLINAAFDSPPVGTDGKSPRKKRDQQLLTVDNGLKRAPGFHREHLVLVLRHGFDFARAANILGFSQEIAEKTFHEAMEQLAEKSGLNPMTVEDLIKLLPSHPLPTASSHQTADLSVMIKDIRGSRINWKAWRRRFILLILLSFLYVAYSVLNR